MNFCVLCCLKFRYLRVAISCYSGLPGELYILNLFYVMILTAFGSLDETYVFQINFAVL